MRSLFVLALSAALALTVGCGGGGNVTGPSASLATSAAGTPSKGETRNNASIPAGYVQVVDSALQGIAGATVYANGAVVVTNEAGMANVGQLIAEHRVRIDAGPGYLVQERTVRDGENTFQVIAVSDKALYAALVYPYGDGAVMKLPSSGATIVLEGALASDPEVIAAFTEALAEASGHFGVPFTIGKRAGAAEFRARVDAGISNLATTTKVAGESWVIENGTMQFKDIAYARRPLLVLHELWRVGGISGLVPSGDPRASLMGQGYVGPASAAELEVLAVFNAVPPGTTFEDIRL